MLVLNISLAYSYDRKFKSKSRRAQEELQNTILGDFDNTIGGIIGQDPTSRGGDLYHRRLQFDNVYIDRNAEEGDEDINNPPTQSDQVKATKLSEELNSCITELGGKLENLIICKVIEVGMIDYEA